MLTLDKVFNAQSVLKSIIRETDLVRAYRIAPECELYLKPENLQITGSFKVRGSAYKIAMLSEEEKARGVIACSAGNHAQGVALAASKNGIKSLICLPDSAPISKVEATKGFGAEVCLVEGCYDDAYKKALELKESEGYTFVHPFDDENVIAGQGTIALEVLNDLDDIDAIVVPVGGGGLISGIAYTAKQIRPSVKVYGVQMSGAPSMYNSVRDGKIECLPTVHTIADGIAVKQPGENTFRLVSEYVDDIALVSDDEVEKVVSFLKSDHRSDYDEQVLEEIERQAAKEKSAKSGLPEDAVENDGDPMLNEAIELVVEIGQASTSLLQRKLRLGYARAARVIDQMEGRGIIGPAEGAKPRQVLMTKDQLMEMKAGSGEDKV